MSKRKILVVDDDPPVRGLLVSALSTTESEVVAAEDSTDALRLAGQHDFFDLVVTDIVMPGMNGIELARQLQQSGKAACFLFVSGYARIESVECALEEFARAEFLYKPFAIAELLRVVQHLCRPAAKSERLHPAEA
jgi:CheY-like chemotaxis protein